MKEDFLHLLWQQQLHSRQLAVLSDGLPLTILKTGFRNRNSGPDFEQAKVRIDGLEWVGSVEIHVRASEWNQHGHTHDPAYQSVVLHVVWEKDTEVFRLDGTPVPTFELKDKVPLEVLLRYRELMNPAPETIPCSPFLKDMARIRITAMQERVLVERLERKGREVLQRYYLTGKDWPETIYQTLGFCLGLKINSEPMEQLAQSVPLKILAGLDWDFNPILALFLGLGGFLEGELGPGGKEIRRDFEFLKSKFNLKSTPLAWKKFRLRPGSFPVQRVALFAALCQNLPDWTRKMTTVAGPQDFFTQGNLRPESDHLIRFFQESGVPVRGLEPTAFLRNSLLINFFSPVLVAFGLHKGDREFSECALEWLFSLPPEPNAVTRRWKEWGIECSSSGESQALIELYQKYCLQKRCMECGLGAFVLNRIQ